MHNPSTIVDEEAFELVIQLEVRKASRFQYPGSVLTVVADPAGEGEVPVPGRLAEQLARVISPVIRGTDLIRVTRTSRTLHVLLVGAHLEDLHVVIQRIIDEAHRHRFQMNGERKALTVSVGGACLPITASTLQDLLTQADTLARQARRERPTGSVYRLP